MEHVLVTGASSGIGEAIVREYAAAGCRVTGVARRKERLERLAAELSAQGAQVKVIAADLSDPPKAGAIVAEAEAAFGPVDVLVNCAGQQIVRPTLGSSADEGEALLRLNLHTPFRLALTVAPGMVARKRGLIVDIASMCSITPMPGMFYYSAAKAGLAAASEVLRDELRGTGVHVLTVFPGPVKSDMSDQAFALLTRTRTSELSPKGTTAELARRIRRAGERRKPELIYPSSYASARWFPNLSRWLALRMGPRPLS
jgi:short-subunit dehydrogenase